MRNILIISCLSVLVAGCGGGSSSTNNSESLSTSTTVKVGDTYVYEDTTSPFLDSAQPNSIVTTNITRKVNQVSSTNELTVTDYYNNYNIYSFDLSEVNTNVKSNTGCSFSPTYNILPTPWSVGEVAHQNIVAICPNSTFNIQISTQALAYEKITVKAGTFNTIKTQISKVATGGISAASPAYTESETCWYDLVSGFAVKCTGTYDYSASIGSTPTGSLLLLSLGSNGKFNFTTELVKINPSTSLSLSANTTDIGQINRSLNLTADQTGNLISASGNYKIQTTQPVNWLNSAVTNDNTVQFTQSSDGLSFISSPVIGQLGTTPASYVVTATLKSDPSKFIAVNISQN